MKNEDKSGKNAPEHSEEHPVKLDRIETKEEYNQDLKQKLEEKYNMQLIKYEELINIAPDFAIWLKSIIRYGNVDSQVLIFSDCVLNNNLDIKENRFKCLLHTNIHKYSITGYVPTKDNSKGYLGCIAVTRKNRVGENWNRGNDLPDGKYSKKTFDSIVRGIVRYEIKNLQLWR